MTTATLTRPATVTAAAPQTEPFALRRPTGLLSGTAADVNIPRIAAPAGLEAWRSELEACPERPRPTEAQVSRVLAGVRAGMTLAEVARVSKLSQARVLDAVVGVGSRMTQANKTGPKVDAYLSPQWAARKGLREAGASTVDGKLLVVLADGWHKAESHGRDVGRCYAAIVVSNPWEDERAVTRWLDTQAFRQDITYAHYAHLRSVAVGTLRTFEDLSEDRDVRQAYLAAFDDVAAAVGSASRAVLELCQPDVAAQDVIPLLRRCYWMVASCRPVAASAKGAVAGDVTAAARLRVLLSHLRAAVAQKPSAFFPRDLSDLSVNQYRLILAEWDLHPSDMEDLSRPDAGAGGDGGGLLELKERIAEQWKSQMASFNAHPAHGDHPTQ